MANIRKRSGSWQVQVRIGGKLTSKTFADKREATIWANRHEIEALEGNAIFGTFADALTKYRDTITPTKRGKNVETIIINRLLTEPWVSKKMSELTVDDLSAYRDKRLQTVKPSTFKREWALIKAVGRAAHHFDIPFPSALFQGVRLPRVFDREVKRITPEQERMLLEGTQHKSCRNKYLKPLIQLALATAMRRGELLSLDWEDVDMENGWIYIPAPKAKSGYSRRVPLVGPALDALNEFKALFGDTGSVTQATAYGVRMSFQRLRKRVNLDHIHFHDLRHEGISRMHEMGLTLPEIQSISGHRELKMLERYSHAATDALVAKMRSATNG